MVQGPVRSREYERDRVKHRMFELRADTIAKLDRAERRQDTDVDGELPGNRSLVLGPAKAGPCMSRSFQILNLLVYGLLRTVSALGPDVWVGGSAGLVFHSADAGQHWIRITPATAAGTLAADIVSIEFTDPRHGKLVTSEGRTWTTSDSGQTWQER